MIEPGFATMLCFVQTDAEVDDPDAALRSALAGSMERITVDGQMSTNDTVLLQATGAAGAPLPDGPARRGAAAARAGDRRRRGGRDPGRPGRGHRGAPTTPRQSASLARSPTRRWSRPRSSAATPTGAGSPRPPGWRWRARSSTSSGPTGSRPPSWRRRRPRPSSSIRLGRGDARRPRLLQRPHPRLHPDQRRIHDMTSLRRDRSSRRCPTSGSSTGGRS